MFGTKSLFFLCALVACNEGHRFGGHGRFHGPAGPCAVNNVCANATNKYTCVRTATQCDFRPTSLGGKAAFCACKGNVTGVLAYYNTWLQSQRRRHDECAETVDSGESGEFGGGWTQNFNDYLKAINATLFASFQCCIGQAQGLYDSTNKVIATAWKQDASASIAIASILAAVNAAIDACASNVTSCSNLDYKTCIVQGCYNAIKV